MNNPCTSFFEMQKSHTPHHTFAFSKNEVLENAEFDIHPTMYLIVQWSLNQDVSRMQTESLLGEL
jgi:hypothetical protein